MCLSACVCVSVCVCLCVCAGTLGGQKRLWNIFELQLQAVVSYLSAGHQIQVLCKSSMHSYPLLPLSPSPIVIEILQSLETSIKSILRILTYFSFIFCLFCWPRRWITSDCLDAIRKTYLYGFQCLQKKWEPLPALTSLRAFAPNVLLFKFSPFFPTKINN